MEHDLHITLAAERLFEVWGIPITNTLLTAWVVIAFLAVFAFVVGRRVSLVPGRIQNFFEAVFELAFNYMEQTLSSTALARRFFPLIMTIFLFIVSVNFFAFLPVVGSIGFVDNGEFLPLFRPAATDLNLTLALAIIAFFAIELTGVVTLGVLKYGSKFFTLQNGVIGFLVGLIELVSNLARLISFSFRLFGNIFAGKVLILVVIAFVPIFLPVPLLLFELFVGFIQAAIFALLTLAFIKIAIEPPHGIDTNPRTHANSSGDARM